MNRHSKRPPLADSTYNAGQPAAQPAELNDTGRGVPGESAGSGGGLNGTLTELLVKADGRPASFTRRLISPKAG